MLAISCFLVQTQRILVSQNKTFVQGKFKDSIGIPINVSSCKRKKIIPLKNFSKNFFCISYIDIKSTNISCFTIKLFCT